MAEASSPEFVPPSEVDGYQLVRPLGRGGMGQVYLAHDTVLDRAVAVKFLLAPPDAETRRRFIIEARAIARLSHPNVVAIHRVGELDGHPYLVSELVRGEGLDRTALPIPWRRALEIGTGLARALAMAHRRGVVHRDIKPANVMLTEEGEVKLLDFGIAKLLGASADSADLTLPSPPSPSRRGREQDALFSLSSPSPGGGGGRGVRSAEPDRDAATAPIPVGDSDATVRPAANAPWPLPAFDASTTRPGVVLGTPAYMAPEVWRGEAAAFCADIYSLGALLYTLCTGAPPHSAASLPELRRIVLDRDARPLLERAPTVDRAFAAVIDRCLRREPSERYVDGNELRAALAELGLEAHVFALPAGNPYRGLQAFEAEHAALYFGRGSETRELLERLRNEAFVLVVGDSGVGKSSLCRAGVLPRVAQVLDARRTWKILRVVPGRHPLDSLARALAPVLELDELAVANLLRLESGSLARELRRALGAGVGIVLFIDQLEELVTLAEPDEAAATAEVLAALAAPSPSVRVLATARGDFLSRLATLPRLGAELTRTLFFVWPLGPERLREAIVGPAKRMGVHFESEVTVDSLVEGAARAQGGLPLLQFALAELWDRRDAAAGTIPDAALADLGGVEGALARHADGVVGAATLDGRMAFRRILRRLVTPEGTRARRTDVELVAGEPAARDALEALVQGRLVVARETPDGPVYELAHEALLAGWGTLVRWLAEDVGSRAARERLGRAVAEWERLGRAREALFSVRLLAEVAGLDPVELTQAETAFISASARAAHRAKQRRWAFALAVPLAAVSAWGAISWSAHASLTRAVGARLRDADAALADVRVRREDADRLRFEAFSLFDGRERERGEERWAQALSADLELDHAYGTVSASLEGALLFDPARRDVRARLAGSLLERAIFADDRGALSVRDELVSRLALSAPDGTFAARFAAPGRVTLDATPLGATVVLERFITPRAGRATLTPVPLRGSSTPLAPLELEPGSYRVTLRAPGRATVRQPFVVERAADLAVRVVLPALSDVPRGFVVVPPGRALLGASGDEGLRRSFFSAVPMHAVEVDGFLIARTETTFAEWLEFLAALPPAERERRRPRVDKGGFGGALALRENKDGVLELRLQPATKAYVARIGEPIVFEARKSRASQDWRRFPVAGVAVEDVEAYAAWLRGSGRVPGARLCAETEWERAARGADGREYPHGGVLAPEDAAFDETYGKEPLAMGPDEVGSHPASRSPFGVDDLVGNVWEWTTSSLATGEHVARGGSFYHSAIAARAVNREVPEPTLRELTVGARICADLPSGAR